MKLTERQRELAKLLAFGAYIYRSQNDARLRLKFPVVLTTLVLRYWQDWNHIDECNWNILQRHGLIDKVGTPHGWFASDKCRELFGGEA